MSRKKVSRANVATVLETFAKFVRAEPPEIRDAIACRVNILLDDLASEDCFGTEGQCDPRGDQR